MSAATRKPCPTCSDGDCHVMHDATTAFDAQGELVPVWECRNCHQTQPRRVRKTQARKELDAILAGDDSNLETLLAHMRRHRRT